ncbi:MAG: metal-dependent hydrolase [Candidatus Babeliales bacterium]
MPNYKGHLIGGFFTFIIVSFVCKSVLPLTINTAIEWLFFSLLGSLFPDIDIKSKGQNFFYRLIGIIFIVLFLQRRLYELALVSFVSLFPLLIRHRGITHSLWFICGIFICVTNYAYLFLPQYANIIFFDIFFFCLGAFSHLVLDLGWRRTFKLH